MFERFVIVFDVIFPPVDVFDSDELPPGVLVFLFVFDPDPDLVVDEISVEEGAQFGLFGVGGVVEVEGVASDGPEVFDVVAGREVAAQLLGVGRVVDEIYGALEGVEAHEVGVGEGGVAVDFLVDELANPVREREAHAPEGEALYGRVAHAVADAAREDVAGGDEGGSGARGHCGMFGVECGGSASRANI